MTKIITADISSISKDTYYELYHLIDCDRKRKADSYIFERDRKLSIMSEICLYYLLASEYSYNNTIIAKGYRDNGKPFFLNIPDLHYSVSHSGHKCIVGISNLSEIGVDIECIIEWKKNRFRYLIFDLFSKEETDMIESVNGDFERFLALWTKKEALFKSCGTGTLKHMIDRHLTEYEMKNIITYNFDAYVVSIANSMEKITMLNAETIGICNMIDCIKLWKMW